MDNLVGAAPNLNPEEQIIPPPVPPKKFLNMEAIEAFVTWFKHLPRNQKVSLAALALIAVSVPASMAAVMNQVRDRSKAYLPITAPITPPVTTPIPDGSSRAQFDGATGYITVNNSGAVNPQKGFTVEAWILPKSASISGQMLVNKTNSTSNAFRLSFYSEANISDTVDQYTVTALFSVADAGLNCSMRNIMWQQVWNGQKVVSWHHVAGVIQADGKMDIFVDGQPSSNNFNSINTLCSQPYNVTVGAATYTQGGAGGYLAGQMDFVRISSVSRYSAPFQPPIRLSNDPGTQVLYTFDGLDASRNVIDSSLYNRYGTITGGVIVSAATPVPTSVPTGTPRPSATPYPTVKPPTPYPTSIPLPTATPRPTIIPLPTPTPRPTPLLSCSKTRPCPPGFACLISNKQNSGYCMVQPTPIPVPVNHSPTFSTNTLPVGNTRAAYNAAVQGGDVDLADTLTMTASGLPNGLSLTSCKQVKTQLTNTLTCQLTGTPKQSGTFQVSFRISDNRGGSSARVVPLTVNAWYMIPLPRITLPTFTFK